VPLAGDGQKHYTKVRAVVRGRVRVTVRVTAVRVRVRVRVS